MSIYFYPIRTFVLSVFCIMMAATVITMIQYSYGSSDSSAAASHFSPDVFNGTHVLVRHAIEKK